MRKLILLSFTTFIVISCGNDKPKSIDDILASGDIKIIQKKKDELATKQQELAANIKRLDDSLKVLSPDRNVLTVTTFKTEAKEFKHYLELQGSVATKQNVIIVPEMNGILTSVYVKEGQTVSKGQVLAKIDDGGLNQQLSQLEIQANLAKTTFERQERLWNQKIGSEIQYLQAKSNYEAQQKAVDQLKTQLSKTNVKAPFSGIIDDVITEQGNVVSAGLSQLFRIVNLNDMYITTDVPETYINDVTVGKSVEVFFPVLGKKIETKVRQTGNYINDANRTFNIEIAVPNNDKNIKPNLTSRLKINDYTNPKGILIPQSMISENAEGTKYVYVFQTQNDGKTIAKKQNIKTGKTQGDDIEVLEGLIAGDVLINEGARSVKDGQVVSVVDGSR